MGINKKAFFFTTVAIALSIVVIVSYNVYNFYGKKDEVKVVETRVVTMNNFIKDVEKDINNAIYIVGFRSLLSLEDYMMKYDTFFNQGGHPSLSVAFRDVFRYGTINSEKMSLMENNTFLNWTKKMIKQANKTDIKLEFTIDDVTIDQTSHWLVVISVDLNIVVKDKKNTATWTIDKVYTNTINITTGITTRFVDPLYLVNHDGILNNTIRKTPISDFGTELPTHLDNSYYIEHNDAPNYLMRFENNLGSSSCCGIESLVNSQKRMDKLLPVLDRSAVDYIYFGTGVTTNCNIQGTPPYPLWFKLDSGHLAFYEAACV